MEKLFYYRNGREFYLLKEIHYSGMRIAYYLNEYYLIPEETIGVKFLRYNPMIINIGSTVTVFNVTRNLQEKLYICESREEPKYRGMGGSFYGAKVEMTKNSEAGKIADDGAKYISDSCPIGEKLLGKKVNESVEVILDNGKKILLRILNIEMK